MDKNGRYSLVMCNLLLNSNKALGLYNYYKNRRELALQILEEKIDKVNKTIVDENKRARHIDALNRKSKITVDDYNVSAKVHFDEWIRLEADIKRLEERNQHQNTEQSEPDQTEDQNSS